MIVERLESRSAPSDFIGLALTSGVGSQAYNIATEAKVEIQVQANILLWDAFNEWYEEQVEGYFNRLQDFH